MSRSAFLRIASFIGDLDHPFYDDERQRDVWNEASAVGLQFVLWATLIASTLMVWIKGRPAVPYSIVPMAIVGIGSTLAVVYAKKRSVEVDTPKNLNFRRGGLSAAIYALYVAGAVRAGRAAAHPEISIGVVAGIAAAAVLMTTIFLAKHWKRMDADFAEARAARATGTPRNQRDSA